MKKLKLVFVSIIMVVLGFQSIAQSTEGKKDRSERMIKELDLTAVQVESMKNINEKYRSQMKTIKEDASLTKEQKREQMKPLREAKEAEVKAVLTEDQFAKLQEMKKNKKGKKRSKKRG